jgi:hypothetical protein
VISQKTEAANLQEAEAVAAVKAAAVAVKALVEVDTREDPFSVEILPPTTIVLILRIIVVLHIPPRFSLFQIFLPRAVILNIF